MLAARQSLLAAIALSVVASGWNTVLALVTIPVMVGGLGFEAYGIYTVAFSIATLGSYLDLGLGWSTTKFVAAARQDDGGRDVGTVLRASLLCQLAIGLLFSISLIVLADWVAAGVLRMAAEDLAVTRGMLRIAALSFLATTLSSGLICGLRGMRRFSAVTLIGVGSTTISVAGAALAAWQGWGVRAAGLLQLAGAVCGLLGAALACRHWLRAGAGGPDLRQQLKAMLGFSLWTYISRIAQMLTFQFDKILFARWSGAAALPFYSVPFNFAQRINFLAGPAVTAIFPLASANGDRDTFVRQYLGASRLVHVVTGAVALGLLALGDRFLAVWLGTEMATQGGFFLRVLTIGFWVMSVWSIDAGCIEGWSTSRTTCIITVTGLLVGVFVSALSWLVLSPGKAVALGVAANFCACGLGSAAVWYRLSRYSLAYVVRRVALPILEMTVMAALISRFVVLDQPRRGVAIFALGALIGSLTLYGLARAFSREEISGILRRAGVFPRAAAN